MSASNVLVAVQIINDLMLAVRTVQSIVNTAAVTGADITDAELDNIRRAARMAGESLDRALADAAARKAAREAEARDT